MIKVFNNKPISEINELREKGLYNAPFALMENITDINISSGDTKALEDKIIALEKKIEEQSQAIKDYVTKTDEQAEIIDELNKDLDILAGDDKDE